MATTYESVSGGVQLFVNGAWKTFQPYKYDAASGSWKPVIACIYRNGTWQILSPSSGATEEPNAYGITTIIGKYTTENNSYGTTVIIG